MSWSVVNVPVNATKLSDEARTIVERLLAAGYEPYGTATLTDGRVLFSFKRMNQDEGTFEIGNLPGQYL